jgi:hypothetical protein
VSAVDSWEAEALADLRHHWGEAYTIGRMGDGLWLAQRRDDRTMLRAATAGELREAIAADYRQRPVPRRRNGGE